MSVFAYDSLSYSKMRELYSLCVSVAEMAPSPMSAPPPSPPNASRTWGALANVSAMAWSPLFPHAEPVRLGVGLPGIRGSETEVGRLVDVLQGHLTAAQAGDEAEERRPLLGVVHGRPNLVG